MLALDMPTEDRGLTSKEAKERLAKHGPNVLPERPPPSDLSILFAQLKSPLVYVLAVAAVVTVFLGNYSDTAIILFAVFINTVLGFFQERKASRALNALRQLVHPKAEVIRDGKRIELKIEKLVPGDMVILSQGDKIPADGELFKVNRLFIAEAILTGESLPMGKGKGDKAYMGTVVTAGQGTMLVGTTGAGTEIGKIALSVQEPEEDTPLKRQLKVFSQHLSVLVIGLVVFVFIVGLITGQKTVEIFSTSVALAVSAIPEGLLVGLTVVLAIGMQRILSKKGLVRKLVSAETLGGVTVICVDKTGTLTSGKMQVVEIEGEEQHLRHQALIANDLDDPIVIAAFNWAKETIKNPKSEIRKYPRLDSLPFSSLDRYFASLNKNPDGKNTIFVNGAPEYLIDWTDLDDAKKMKIREHIEKLTKEGKRLMGMATKDVEASKNKLSKGDIKSGFKWRGILAFSDPIRNGVKEAFEKTKEAGVATIVITGDYPQTAISVMEQLGLDVDKESVILGSELKKFNTLELAKRLEQKDGAALFARTTPEQKLNIVNALKKNNEVVAMMGDGVNDAPALNKADIGIVVGEASDVAKETADLILLDSSFATIVAAIEEGRGMFDNIRKIILYLMSDAFEEILVVVLSILAGLPLAVTAAQIIWINLVSDGFPHLALTVDPKNPGLMSNSPRNPSERIVTPWMRWLIFIVSLYGGMIAFLLYSHTYETTGNVDLARSIAFATLGINSLFYVFSIRTLRQPFWVENPFGNKWLNVAVVVGLFFQVIPFIFEPLRNFLNLEALSLQQWAAVFGAALLMFFLIELTKVIARRKLRVDNR